MCQGFLSIAYDLIKQYKSATEILKGCCETPHKEPKGTGNVELIIGQEKYNLNEVLIVEEQSNNKINYEGFLKNLGSTISAKFVDKNYKSKPVEPESELVVLKKDKTENNIIIEELLVNDCMNQDTPINIDQFIIETSSDIPHQIIPMQMVSNTNVYKCDTCQKECSSEVRLFNHMKICMDNVYADVQLKTFICPICKGSFVKRDALMQHIQTTHGHTEKAFFCNKCDHVAYSSSALTYHMHLHKDKSYQCEICGRVFKTKFLLTNHKQTHDPVTKVLCPICGKGFNYKNGLFYHMRIHNKERCYRCDFCDKSFYMLNSLKRHMRTHTGIRPYGCSYCAKKFFSKGEVSKHEMLHTGVRPYKCQHCGQGFITKFNLKKHYLTHGGPYTCEYCDRNFIGESYLNIHKKLKHKELFNISV